MRFISLIVVVATLGGFMFGYDSGAINGTTKGLALAFGLDEANLGLTASSLLPGCALGAFMAGRLADVMGRRQVMLAAAVLFIVSALASGAAGSALMFAPHGFSPARRSARLRCFRPPTFPKLPRRRSAGGCRASSRS